MAPVLYDSICAPFQRCKFQLHLIDAGTWNKPRSTMFQEFTQDIKMDKYILFWDIPDNQRLLIAALQVSTALDRCWHLEQTQKHSVANITFQAFQLDIKVTEYCVAPL